MGSQVAALLYQAQAPGTELRVHCGLPVWMSSAPHQLEAPAVWKSVWNIHIFQSLLPWCLQGSLAPWHVPFTAFHCRHHYLRTTLSSASLSTSLQLAAPWTCLSSFSFANSTCKQLLLLRGIKNQMQTLPCLPWLPERVAIVLMQVWFSYAYVYCYSIHKEKGSRFFFSTEKGRRLGLLAR